MKRAEYLCCMTLWKEKMKKREMFWHELDKVLEGEDSGYRVHIMADLKWWAREMFIYVYDMKAMRKTGQSISDQS